MQWFGDLLGEIVQNGNGIIQLHRAHRLDTLKKVKKKEPDIEMLFGGYLGGEIIKGLFYDDLIISEFLRLYWKNSQKLNGFVTGILEKKFIRVSSMDIKNIVSKLSELDYIKAKSNEREFYMLFSLCAAVHHAQDLNLFSFYARFPIAIYLDIDFLYIIFSSKYNFLFKKNTLFKKITDVDFTCNLIPLLAPELEDVPFAKRGYFSCKEYNKNKVLLIAKRTFRYLFKYENISSFSLDQWMIDFVKNEINKINTDELNDIILYDRLVSRFSMHRHRKDESYWQKYTDIVMLYHLYNYYLKGKNEYNSMYIK